MPELQIKTNGDASSVVQAIASDWNAFWDNCVEFHIGDKLTEDDQELPDTFDIHIHAVDTEDSDPWKDFVSTFKKFCEN